MNVYEAFAAANRLNRGIEEYLRLIGDEMDNVEGFNLSSDAALLRSELFKITDKLDDVNRMIKYLQLPIREEGFLRHNESGRYAFPSEDYLTSGSRCELFYDGEWILTTIEHANGDYYATALGKDISIDGLLARIRR